MYFNLLEQIHKHLKKATKFCLFSPPGGIIPGIGIQVHAMFS